MAHLGLFGDAEAKQLGHKESCACLSTKTTWCKAYNTVCAMPDFVNLFSVNLKLKSLGFLYT